MNKNLDKYEKALYYEIFEKKEYGILNQIIINSKIIFDVGGHIGLFSLYSLSLNNNLEIHYFEPVRDYFDKAKLILKDFDNIVFNNFGILNISGNFEILRNNKISSQSSIYSSFLNKTGTKEICNMRNLGEYIKENNILNIDLLKMDIEGSEFEVLLNLSDEIYKKIKVLFFEYHILNDEFENKLILLKEKLRLNYKDIEIIKSSYNDKIGYMFCKN